MRQLDEGGGGDIPLHRKPSWSRKNSRKAASRRRSTKRLGWPGGREESGWEMSDRVRLCGLSRLLLWWLPLERQTWASKPSICRRPFRVRAGSREERLSKDKVRRFSIADEVSGDGGGSSSSEDGYQ